MLKDRVQQILGRRLASDLAQGIGRRAHIYRDQVGGQPLRMSLAGLANMAPCARDAFLVAFVADQRRFRGPHLAGQDNLLDQRFQPVEACASERRDR